MTTKEALQAMLDGNRIRGKDWRSGQFMGFEGNTVVDADGIYFYSLTMNLAEDWEIYEEPKPKQVVVIEKWLCKSAWDNYFIIEGEVAFFKTGGYDEQQVKLLDTYEVEL